MEEKEKKRIKIPVPEEVLEKFLNWFDSNKRVAFLMALIFGVITHITMITETVMSQDGIWNSMQYSRAGDWELSLGRWGIEFAQRLNNFIAVPSITTIMCIFFMAIAAVFLVDIFGFKSKYSAAFTGIILVVSPCLTATMLYVYTTVAYCLDMLLTIMAIWFIYKFKYKKIGLLLATFCFAFALSIYQSYMGVTIGLCIMLSVVHKSLSCSGNLNRKDKGSAGFVLFVDADLSLRDLIYSINTHQGGIHFSNDRHADSIFDIYGTAGTCQLGNQGCNLCAFIPISGDCRYFILPAVACLELDNTQVCRSEDRGFYFSVLVEGVELAMVLECTNHPNFSDSG